MVKGSGLTEGCESEECSEHLRVGQLGKIEVIDLGLNHGGHASPGEVDRQSDDGGTAQDSEFLPENVFSNSAKIVVGE